MNGYEQEKERLEILRDLRKAMHGHNLLSCWRAINALFLEMARTDCELTEQEFEHELEALRHVFSCNEEHGTKH